MRVQYGKKNRQSALIYLTAFPSLADSSWMRTYATTSQGLIKFLTKAYVEWYKFYKAAAWFPLRTEREVENNSICIFKEMSFILSTNRTSYSTLL